MLRSNTALKSRVYRPAIQNAHGHSHPHGTGQRRQFFWTDAVLPPLVFSGLVVALFTWKSMMMVIFQNKIIYMPGLPPNARRERIVDYEKQCLGILWREERIKSIDGTNLGLCVTRVRSRNNSERAKRIYIVYFQGNASSIPPRLPSLSIVMKMLKDSQVATEYVVEYVMVCCSYRGYWTSQGRPSEKGIAKDAAATLDWIVNDVKTRDHDSVPIAVALWGQSIGAAVATSLAARQELFSTKLGLKAVILETPFLSARTMLVTLYPQKWLPYRYLWPFLRIHLDSWKALGDMKEGVRYYGLQPPKIVILEAGRDELVDREQSAKLEQRCISLGLPVRKKFIRGALHTEVMEYHEGRNAVAETIQNAIMQDGR